ARDEQREGGLLPARRARALEYLPADLGRALRPGELQHPTARLLGGNLAAVDREANADPRSVLEPAWVHVDAGERRPAQRRELCDVRTDAPEPHDDGEFA